MTKIRNLFLLFTGLIVLSCEEVYEAASIREFREDLLGEWESVDYEDNGATFGFRRLKIEKSRWSIEVNVYADANGQFPLFRIDYEGPYEITGPSSVLPGAFNGTFAFAEKHLTLLTDDPAVIEGLGFQDCGLQLGIKTDVSEMGCSFVESVEECPADYDLISIEDGILYPGRRTDNMCEPEGRPTQRGFPMRKKH